jgi:hypothetical protein
MHAAPDNVRAIEIASERDLIAHHHLSALVEVLVAAATLIFAPNASSPRLQSQQNSTRALGTLAGPSGDRGRQMRPQMAPRTECARGNCEMFVERASERALYLVCSAQAGISRLFQQFRSESWMHASKYCCSNCCYYTSGRLFLASRRGVLTSFGIPATIAIG